MVPANDNVYPYATFSLLLNLGSLIESVLDPNRARCSVGSDLGTNYLQSILSDSLGPVVNRTRKSRDFMRTLHRYFHI